MKVLPLPTDKIEVPAPTIDVSQDEAEQIVRELDQIKLHSVSSPHVDGISIRKQIRLGLFSEAVGGVRLRGGAVLLAEQIALRHLQRLDAIAQEMKDAKELKEIAYSIGYLQAQIARSSNKAKIVVEYVPPTVDAKPVTGESWKPGQIVTARPQANGVAGHGKSP